MQAGGRRFDPVRLQMRGKHGAPLHTLPRTGALARTHGCLRVRVCRTGRVQGVALGFLSFDCRGWVVGSADACASAVFVLLICESGSGALLCAQDVSVVSGSLQEILGLPWVFRVVCLTRYGLAERLGCPNVEGLQCSGAFECVLAELRGSARVYDHRTTKMSPGVGCSCAGWNCLSKRRAFGGCLGTRRR